MCRHDLSVSFVVCSVCGLSVSFVVCSFVSVPLFSKKHGYNTRGFGFFFRNWVRSGRGRPQIRGSVPVQL